MIGLDVHGKQSRLASVLIDKRKFGKMQLALTKRFARKKPLVAADR
jgi:hypothetical protein